MAGYPPRERDYPAPPRGGDRDYPPPRGRESDYPPRGGGGYGPPPERRGPPPRTTLFVAGFPPEMRAADLAYYFERLGPLVRCDIPALRSMQSKPYAFIEYEDPRDAAAAHAEMHGVRFGGFPISIQFAKNAPSANWRFDGAPAQGPPPPRGPPRRRRSPSPRRGGGGPNDESRDRYRGRNDRDSRRGGPPEEDRYARDGERERGYDRSERERSSRAENDEPSRESAPRERGQGNGVAIAGSAGKDKKETSEENGAETTSAAAEPVESAATGEAEAVEIADSSALTPPPAVDDEEKDDRDE